METFIAISLALSVLGVLLKTGQLCVVEYPRTEEVAIGCDVLSLITNMIWSGWAVWLLFLRG